MHGSLILPLPPEIGFLKAQLLGPMIEQPCTQLTIRRPFFDYANLVNLLSMSQLADLN